MDRLEELRQLPKAELMRLAWTARESHFPPRLFASVPGAKRYRNNLYQNRPGSFVNITLTEDLCALSCDHCKGSLLKTMVPAGQPGELVRLGEELVRGGARGVLLSGGCDPSGAVPVGPHLEAISRLKEMGLVVLVHSGLVSREEARSLKGAGVDQILLDVIGDEDTIREVYHLDKTPSAYRRTLEILREEGLAVAPHIILGLNRGRLGGEYVALEMITANDPVNLVLVVLQPLPGTPMEGLPVPAARELGRLAAIARLLNPTTPVSLGCARPAGREKVVLEIQAVEAGVTAVAYPGEGTVVHAQKRGLAVEFAEVCCSLLGMEA